MTEPEDRFFALLNEWSNEALATRQCCLCSKPIETPHFVMSKNNFLLIYLSCDACAANPPKISLKIGEDSGMVLG